MKIMLKLWIDNFHRKRLDSKLMDWIHAAVTHKAKMPRKLYIAAFFSLAYKSIQWLYLHA